MSMMFLFYLIRINERSIKERAMITFNSYRLPYSNTQNISIQNNVSFGANVQQELKEILERRMKRPWAPSVAASCRSDIEDLFETNPIELFDMYSNDTSIFY